MEERIDWIIGIDEAGRGALAGPLAFGAVAIRPSALPSLNGIRDSKKLSARQRVQWYERIVATDAAEALYG